MDFCIGHVLSFLQPDPLHSMFSESGFDILETLAGMYPGLRDEYYKMCIFYGKPIRHNCFRARDNAAFDSFKKTSLFEFIAGERGLVVAGGFPTQLWLNQTPLEVSDVDVFVFDRSTLNHIIDFAASQGVKLAELVYKTGIFQFQLPNFKHTVQIIWSERSVIGVVRSFDFSHCRCIIYAGKLYATPDAEFSLRTKKTVLYSKYVRLCRIKKALRYIDDVINVKYNPLDLDCNCNSSSTRLLVDLEILRDTAQPTSIKNYTGGRHRTIYRTRVVKKYHVINSYMEPIFYLEWCARALDVQPTFSLVYTKPWDIYIEDRYFYTRDERYLIVYRFWESVLDLAEKADIKRRIGQKRFPIHMLDWTLMKLLKPMRAFNYFPVFNRQFEDGVEYELKVVFRNKYIVIL